MLEMASTVLVDSAEEDEEEEDEEYAGLSSGDGGGWRSEVYSSMASIVSSASAPCRRLSNSDTFILLA